MNLNAYPNIAKAAEQLGGVKETLINKKRLAESEELFNALPQEFLQKVDQEITAGIKVLSNYITPSAIIMMDLHTIRIIPAEDIVWLYVQVSTTRMNFVPMNKTHSLFMTTRNGECFNLGFLTTGGFSKKEPMEENVQNIKSQLSQTCPGIIYGWSKEIEEQFKKNFSGMVQLVEERNNGIQ